MIVTFKYEIGEMNTDKMIVSFGEALWDVLPTGAKLGGAPLNFIYRINCLEEQGLLCLLSGCGTTLTNVYLVVK